MLISFEICQETELISNLCYNDIVPKKISKTLKNIYFGTLFKQKQANIGHTKNQAQLVFVDTTIGIQKLSRSFYFIKVYALTEL